MKIEITVLTDDDGEYTSGLYLGKPKNLAGIDVGGEEFTERVFSIVWRFIPRIILLAEAKRTGLNKDELYALWDDRNWPNRFAVMEITDRLFGDKVVNLADERRKRQDDKVTAHRHEGLAEGVDEEESG
jgi:hypothetical protein